MSRGLIMDLKDEIAELVEQMSPEQQLIVLELARSLVLQQDPQEARAATLESVGRRKPPSAESRTSAVRFSFSP
jgi:hypothetical protein